MAARHREYQVQLICRIQAAANGAGLNEHGLVRQITLEPLRVVRAGGKIVCRTWDQTIDAG